MSVTVNGFVDNKIRMLYFENENDYYHVALCGVCQLKIKVVLKFEITNC